MADSFVNSDKMFKNFDTQLNSMNKASANAGKLFSLGPISLPNQMFGLDMRSKAQKAAQAEPEQFKTAMHDFLQELEKALNKVHDVVLDKQD